MYESFYGFREKPFHVTADPAFLYLSSQHQEALSHLLYGIRERLGFIVIVGEVGTGKTTLAKSLIQRLQEPTRTALILNPALNGTQLLQAILRDFEGEPAGSVPPDRQNPETKNRGPLLMAIERFLIRQASTQGTAVVVIDEAQALSAAALEQVRLLSTVETTKTKLLQIVLIGQPELDHRLTQDSRLRALRQRIAVHYRIQPLNTQEVAAYIQHRLQVAGPDATVLFTPGALERIAEISRGLPRSINQICDQALLAGFVRETHEINETVLEEALSPAYQPSAQP